MKGSLRSNARGLAAVGIALLLFVLMAVSAAARIPVEDPAAPAPAVAPSPSGAAAGHGLDATGGVLYNPNPYGATATANKSKFDSGNYKADMWDCDSGPHKDDGFGVGCGVHNMGEFFKSIFAFLDNPMAGILSFMMHTLSADHSGNSPLGSIVSGKPMFLDSTGYTDNIFSRMWSVFLSMVGVTTAISVCLKVVANARHAEKWTDSIIEVVPRAVFGLAAAAFSFKLLATLVTVASDIGGNIMLALVNTTSIGGGADPVAGLASMASSDNMTQAPMASLGMIVALLMFMYVIALMVIRYVMLVFTVVTAPVAISLGAMNQRNEFFAFWFRMFVGAAIAPIIMGIGMGITLTVAIDSGDGHLGMGGSMAATIFLIGGFWFLGKMMHHLTMGAFHGHTFMSLLGSVEGGLFMHRRLRNWAPGGKRGSGYASRSIAGGQVDEEDSATGENFAAGGARSDVPVSSPMGATPEEKLRAVGDKTPTRRAFQNFYDNGGWKDQVDAQAAASGQVDASAADKVSLFLSQPFNASVVHDTFTRALNYDGVSWFDASDPKWTYDTVMSRHLESAGIPLTGNPEGGPRPGTPKGAAPATSGFAEAVEAVGATVETALPAGAV
ncbi:MAG: TrbL/VirB6 family protein [Candidatus Dormibacteria bacterium]